MIVSHQYKFVIACPVGLNAADWLNRIAAEGPTGYLEIIGHPNGVVVPEDNNWCAGYTRYFVDSPRHRLPQLWSGRLHTPWEGPAQVQDANDPTEWLKWYVWSMRKKYLEVGVSSSPNGWGMRAVEGDWMFFESPAILARTFAGYGNSPLGEDAPWGRAEIRVIYMEEATRGWRDVLRKVVGETFEAQLTRELINWHVPVSQMFFELPEELASAYLRDTAWKFTAQKGIEKT